MNSGYILMSYDDSDKEYVRKIWNHLLEHGFAVRADIDVSKELILDSLSDSVKNAAAVVVYLSANNMENSVCKTICRYSCLYNKKIVAVSMQTDLTLCGWVTELQSCYQYLTLLELPRFGTFADVMAETINILQNHSDVSGATRVRTATTATPARRRTRKLGLVHSTHPLAVRSGTQTDSNVDRPLEDCPVCRSTENLDPQTENIIRIADETGELVCFVCTPLNDVVTNVTEVTSAVQIALDDGEELVSEIIKVDTIGSSYKESTITVRIPLHRHQIMTPERLLAKSSMDDGTTWNTVKSLLKTYEGISVCEMQVQPFGIYGVVTGLDRDTLTIGRNGGTVNSTTDPKVCLTFEPNELCTSDKVHIMVRPVKPATNLSKHSVISCTPFLVVEFETDNATNVPVKITLPIRHPTGNIQEKSHRPTTAPNRKKHHPDTKTSSFHVLSKIQTGTWTTDDVFDIQKQKDNIVCFSTNSLSKRNKMIVIETKSTDSLREVANILENTCDQQTTNVILHHHKDNEENFITRLVPRENCKDTVAELREENYCGPPAPSKDVMLKEGQLVKLTTEGNIRIIGRHEITFRFYKNLRVKEEFLVEFVDPQQDVHRRCYLGKCIYYLEHSEKSQNFSIMPRKKSSNSTWERLVVFDISLKKYGASLQRGRIHSEEITSQHDALSENIMLELTDKLGVEWTRLGIHLGLSNAQIQRLKLDYSHTRERSFQMLIRWYHSTPGDLKKIRQLSCGLIKEGRCDLSQWLLKETGMNFRPRAISK